jgi:hypothetical protein
MNVVALHTWVHLGGHFKYYSNICHKGATIATRHTTFSTKNNIWSYFQTLWQQLWELEISSPHLNMILNDGVIALKYLHFNPLFSDDAGYYA